MHSIQTAQGLQRPALLFTNTIQLQQWEQNPCVVLTAGAITEAAASATHVSQDQL
jgi:hypothetical protein